jgi:hypothetical protein
MMVDRKDNGNEVENRERTQCRKWRELQLRRVDLPMKRDDVNKNVSEIKI